MESLWREAGIMIELRRDAALIHPLPRDDNHDEDSPQDDDGQDDQGENDDKDNSVRG